MSNSTRPTKKQTELLSFIDAYISEHGYSPSYREIMSGCNYNSVATVAVHVNNLVSRGHLQKRQHSARSLEVIKPGNVSLHSSDSADSFVKKVEKSFKSAEIAPNPTQKSIDNLYVLVGALTVLSYPQAHDYKLRLVKLKNSSTSKK